MDGDPSLSMHLAEDEHLAGAEDVGRRPVERAPVQSQTQVALALRREPTNRGAVERQVVGRLDQELLVVVQHVQPTFEVAEQNGDSLDAFFVRQVFEPLLLNLSALTRYRRAPSPRDSALRTRRRESGDNRAVRKPWPHVLAHSETPPFDIWPIGAQRRSLRARWPAAEEYGSPGRQARAMAVSTRTAKRVELTYRGIILGALITVISPRRTSISASRSASRSRPRCRRP